MMRAMSPYRLCIFVCMYVCICTEGWLMSDKEIKKENVW